MSFNTKHDVIKMEEYEYNDGIFAARISDNVLETEDWSVDVIHIEGGVVVAQYNVYNKTYTLPDMVKWTTKELYEWVNHDDTGSFPENSHEIRVVQSW
jgi:hypothetical protein